MEETSVKDVVELAGQIQKEAAGKGHRVTDDAAVIAASNILGALLAPKVKK